MIWESRNSWVKHFVIQVARGAKPEVIRALYVGKTKQQIMDGLENWANSQGPFVQVSYRVYNSLYLWICIFFLYFFVSFCKLHIFK